MKTLLAALLTTTFLATAVPAFAADQPAGDTGGDKAEKKDKKAKDKKGDKADKKAEAPAGGGW